MIGVAGGIGSGKSAVAAALAALGWWVSDSDRSVREILARPETAETLRAWWGPGVLDAQGLVDRGAVARVVFQDPAQRRRLEALIHPLVHAERARLRAEAARAGAPGVVLDAPLLYEVGLDRECDAVIFVDAPREVRLERVRRTRGWDEAELARREAAQMPPERKRALADAVVVNDGSEEQLRRRVAEALRRVEAKIARGREPGLPGDRT